MTMTCLALLAAGYAIAACRITRPLLWDRFYDHVIWKGPTSQPPKLCLTFDDGPDPTNTPRLLDVLERHGVPATFFLLGKRAERHPGLVERMRASGHEIGNHSYGHKKLILCSRAEIEQEVDAGAAAIRKAGGGDPGLFRPPHGLRDPRVLSVTADRGYKCILWSVMPWDWTQPPSTWIERWVRFRAHAGAIVVLHDGGGDRSGTVEAVDRLLPRLLDRGFEFTTVSELLSQ